MRSAPSKWLALVWMITMLGTAGCGGGRLVVAAGTTVVDSGFLDALAAAYEAESGTAIAVTGVSTAEALSLGGAGSVDMMIVHAPAAEAAFLADHPAAVVAPVFASEFILVGPADLAARYEGMTLEEAMAAIAAGGTGFVSRADGSGTHEREMAAWAEVGVIPRDEEWYLQTGQGMGLTLQVASEREAFTIAELGAFDALAGRLALERVALRVAVPNAYRAIVLDGRSAAGAFTAWLTSRRGRDAIVAANINLFGTVVYAPAAADASDS